MIYWKSLKMQEIFKANGTLPRSLIEKVICFDRLKEHLAANKLGLTNSIIKEILEQTHESLDYLKKSSQIISTPNKRESNINMI